MKGLFLHKTPQLLQAIFPNFWWRKSRLEKTVYLTFDDGPVPEATPLILKCLREYGAKATFFCVGENIVKNPKIFHQLIEEEHGVGNHTHHHLNGWETDTDDFINDIVLCQKQFDKHLGSNSKPLMRPPYGRLKYSQWKSLLKDYEIVMWDVLSGDFSKRISREVCLRKSIQYTKSGSIVLFHDSVKTVNKLEFVLPKYLEHFSRLGYSFQRL